MDVNTLLIQANRGTMVETEVKTLTLNGLTISATNRAVTINGNEINLTGAEFEILWILASNAGQVLTRNSMSKLIRGFEYDGLNRSLDLRIARLRKKLGDDGRRPRLIKSVRSVGYMLVED